MTEAPDLEPLPALPPNAAVLTVRPAADKVHTILRLTYDVTHLSDDQKKLLLHLLTAALTDLEKGVKDMHSIAVASRLANLERVKARKGNGQ